MAVLRPLVEIAAEVYRNSVELALKALEDSVSKDQNSYVFLPDPAEVNIRYIPAREGKSLLSPVKRRSIMKRRSYPRWREL